MKKTFLKRLLHSDTAGGWILIAVGHVMLYRYVETNCSAFPFIECGYPSRNTAFLVIFIGVVLVVLRAIYPKKTNKTV